MVDAQIQRFIEAKGHLSTEQVLEIVAERLTFLDADTGRSLAEHGAAREEHVSGESGQSSWVVEPAFRDFLKRSV